MSVNYDRVCRLCLSSRGELLPIFATTSSDESEPHVLASKIKDCVSVQINENDELPSNACRKCVDNVNNWFIFKSVCERTQNKLLSLKKDGSLLEEVKVKSEPQSDEAYDDGVVIDGSYPESEENAANKIQPEGPPILASLGLTPRSDKGVDSDNNEEEEEELEEDEEEDSAEHVSKALNIPEVSITVMRPAGDMRARQGMLTSKHCLVCNREYRYSHNARRHELTAHSFDRYTNKIQTKRPQMHLQPKLRPNPFNPKMRLMPNPLAHRMQFLPKTMPNKMIPHKVIPKPVPIKPLPKQQQHQQHNTLPYPLRIKALKDLQIKKKEPQILKTLLTAKPEVLVSEPEIMNSSPGSPETLISEPEIASFQVETILTEPDGYESQPGEEEAHDDHNDNQKSYDTVNMESDNEIEIARERQTENEEQSNEGHDDDEKMSDVDANSEGKDMHEIHGENNEDNHEDSQEEGDYGEGNDEAEVEEGAEDQEEEEYEKEMEGGNENEEAHENYSQEQEDEVGDEEDEPVGIAPVVEINEGQQGDDGDEHDDADDAGDHADDHDDAADDTVEGEVDPTQALEGDADPDKVYVTKAQREFIKKYSNIIKQINTKRCLCCDKEYPRRKAVIQHLQKNGHMVPKHTCYNCVVTFGHIGALLSHMRANVCTDLWKIIYNENGISDDMVIDPINPKSQYKDIFNARSYACKLCPAKFQLKQSMTKHVLDAHEDGQSTIPKTCVHCRYRFKERHLLKKHVRNGDCIINIACDMCSERFENVQDFNNHALEYHAGNPDQTADLNQSSKCIDDRPTDCPLCEKKFSTYQTLVKHLKFYHDEHQPHYCQNCDEKFEKPEELHKHIFTMHWEKVPGTNSSDVDMSIVKEEAEEYHYSCTECNAIFETVDAWTDHQVAEHNQVAHHCDQCEKKFLRPSELAEHKNTHLRVKLYPCSVCADSYSTPQKLAEHVQAAHPGAGGARADLDFYCNICIRSFKSRQAYSNHMRIHAKVPTTNRRPIDPKGFSPQIIGKPIKEFPEGRPVIQFKSNCNVPNAPYSCDICGKGFMHKKNIWKHKKVLHADIVGERNDSEENTMHGSTEEEEFNVDENGIALTTPRFNSFNFSNIMNNAPNPAAPVSPPAATFACDICNKKFPLKSSVIKHKRAKHGYINPPPGSSDAPASSDGSRANCTLCKITFSDKKSYYRHRKTVHKSSVQACKICGIPLGSTLELYEHLKAAHARELLGYNDNQAASSKSNVVGQELDVVDYEGEHEANDPSSEYQARYPCENCGKQFVGLLALQNHQCINQVEASPETYDCEICHKSYTSIAALKSHRGWHLRSPDGKAAANNTSLWMPQHKVTNKMSKHEVVDAIQLAKVSHSTPNVAKRRLPPEVEVTVVNPNKKLRSDDSMEVEHQNVSGAEDRYCTICDKEFTKRAAYQRHMDEVHQPNSVFCPVCDKSFTRKSTLLVHMRKHYEGGEGSSSGAIHDEDTYACDICESSFQTPSMLRAHKMQYHGEDSEEEEEEEAAPSVAPAGEFTCGQCGDGVATPRDLIAHRSMHVTPSKYFCTVCKVYFARGGDLSAHMRARHSAADGDKAFFPCAMCDRFYMNKKSLQRHIDMAH